MQASSCYKHLFIQKYIEYIYTYILLYFAYASVCMLCVDIIYRAIQYIMHTYMPVLKYISLRGT